VLDPIINNNNDDDIFDDNKTLFGSNESTSSNFSSRKEYTNSLDDVFDDFFNGKDLDGSKIDQLIEKFGSEIAKTVGNVRFELASTFYESASKWFFEYKVDKTSYATYSCLTELTNGKYPLYQRFYDLEIDIVKRHIICSFLTNTFLTETSAKSFEQLSKIFNAPVDKRFIKTYFESIFEMLYFTNIQDIGLYKALAKEISLPVLDSVIEGSARLDSLVNSQRRNSLFVAALSDDLKQSISFHVKEEMSAYEHKED